ncbi:putative hydroxylase [Halobacteriovorax marinus SJ]|uniref:Hydroxylase n=1 Tax=Halobacteriovorax marinus (strain ATCC BAA-682 / DSM 15412 / SJ) TaxID=862908 RepID=E1WXN0_HALMS|nr:fatty acid desaturase [Halobacteriovorax marinus]CBW25836.1 putative hydroxylase [Halobacteriovorax marinus SJ]
MEKKRDYTLVNDVNCHVKRRAEILQKYPAVKELYGTNPLSALYISLIVTLQFILATLIKDQAWWAILILSYTVGAVANHSLYVMIHECCHNTVFKKAFYNKVMGIICDLPLFLPSAMGFRKYHMIHHKHLGEYSYDPDITSRLEADLIGNNPFKKALWLALFSLSQALRPLKVQYYKPLDRWSVINTIVIVAVNIAIYFFIGPGALIYLALSTLFALGLHPLGGRWIQEHYITEEGQETYSYYGILNKLTFNMGYHNEHHDFMHIPWSRLPELKKAAPEYYDNLKSYQSWTRVLLNFIFNPKMDSYSRIIHPDRHPKRAIE